MSLNKTSIWKGEDTMSLNKTSISWATHSVNVTCGCSPAGEGCRFCYARDLHTKRHKAYLEGKLQKAMQYAKPFDVIQLLPERLDDLRQAPTGARVFVDSMSDLFHEAINDEFIKQVLTVTRCVGEATFILATKRPQRAATIATSFWPPNLWLLTSVSTQEDADSNIPHLLEIPAAVRGISYEPALGPLVLDGSDGSGPFFSYVTDDHSDEELGEIRMTGLDWVVCGAESGPNRRPCKIEWIREVVQQCEAAGVACFVKQLTTPKGKLLKHWEGATEEEWPLDLRVRQYPGARREITEVEVPHA